MHNPITVIPTVYIQVNILYLFLRQKLKMVEVSQSRKILLLGSGFVAGPCLEYLARNPKNKITVGILHRSGIVYLLKN